MVVSSANRSVPVLQPGEKIGDYEVIEKIGQGGVAEIYRGRQRSLDRQVAIKLLGESATLDSDIVSRFEQEAKIIAKLNHPNIVHVIDRGVDNNRYYFVMEFIEGTDFKEILARDKYDFEQKIDVVVNLLKALDYAHKNGVIHRDIKPSNILIDRNENVLVADFGIAQILDKEPAEQTQTGIVMGTLAYMSPEQKLSSKDIGITTDIYATGVILYEIATTRKPMGRFKPPTEINPNLPAKFDEIILKCLEQDTRDRYQTAVELKDAILSAVYDTSVAKRQPKSEVRSSVKDFIGNCSFLDTIKESAYGATYLVENKANGRLYVIKKMIKRELGLKEARILAKLDHPNILRVYGAGGDQNKNVIVTEYAQGGSLADRLVKPYPLEEGVSLFRQIAEGLSFAHKNHVIHGNLRPSNVLFGQDDTAKLTDFALPQHYNKNQQDWYAAPERKKEKCSDVYSAGVLFHQILTNKLPIFDSYGKLVWQPDEVSIPMTISELIRGMLRRDISERVSSMGEVLSVIDKYEAETFRQNQAAADEDLTMKAQRKSNPIRIIVLLTLLIATLIVAAYILKDAGYLDSLFSLTSNL